MSKNIVHQYFKKESEGAKILVKVNPIFYTGTEMTIPAKGTASIRMLPADETMMEQLQADGFVEVNGIEFNLIEAKLI